MLPTFRQTNTSNLSSFVYLLLLFMDWDDSSYTCCCITQIHIYQVSDRFLCNFHIFVFCIYLVNQVGFCMFDITIMYTQISRTSPHAHILLRLMSSVQKCWNSGTQICHEYVHMCRVCIFAKYDIDLSGSTHCCRWWRSMLEPIVHVVMVWFHCSNT